MQSYHKSIIDHGVQVQQEKEMNQSSNWGEGLVAKI